MHFVLFNKGNAYYNSRAVDSFGDISSEMLRGALVMKVVVVKSPKMFAGLLRLMFGIKDKQ